MRLWTLRLWTASLSFACLHINSFSTSVIELDEETFDDYADSEHMLLFFYAPWCSHCEQLHPHFEEAATMLAEVMPGLIMAKVDATQATDLAAEYSLKSYPTLKWLANGEATDYTGQRTAAKIVSWVKRHTAGEVAVLRDAAAMQALRAKGVVVVGYFDERIGNAYNAFNEAGLDSEKVPFVVRLAASCEGDDCVDETFPSVVLYKTFDEGRAIHSGSFNVHLEAYEFTKAGIEAFVKLEAMPSTLEFLPENVPKIFDMSNQNNANAPKHILLFTSTALPAHEAAVSALAEAYPSYKGDLINVVIDLDKETSAKIVSAFAMTADQVPCLRGFDIGSNRKFLPESAFEATAEYVEDLAASFLGGEIEGKIASQRSAPPPPEGENDGPVTVVVGRTFKELVLDPTKDVLLEIYAPWCGFCQSFESTYRQIGEHYQAAGQADGVRVAKMDGTTNEVAGLEIASFPTIQLFPRRARTAGEGVLMAQTPWTWTYDEAETIRQFGVFVSQHESVDGTDEL